MSERGTEGLERVTLRERITAISDIRKILASTAGAAVRAERMLDRIIDITGAARCALYLVEPSTAELELRTARSGSGRLCEQELLTDEKSAAGRAFAAGGILFQPAHGPACGADEPRPSSSVVCAPFSAEGVVAGVIQVSGEPGGASFCPEDVEFMEDLAAETGLLLKRLAAQAWSDAPEERAAAPVAPEAPRAPREPVPDLSALRADKEREPSDTEKVFGILKNLDFLSVLTMEDVERILPELKKITFERGAYAVRQGNAGGAMFLVASGRLSVWIRPERGEEVKVGEIGPLEYFGEMSLITGEPRVASVKAEEKTELFILSREIFDSVLINDPVISERIRLVIRERKMKNEALLSPPKEEAPKGFFGLFRKR